MTVTVVGLSPVTRYTVSVQPIVGASLQRADTTVTITVQTLPPGQPSAALSICTITVVANNKLSFKKTSHLGFLNSSVTNEQIFVIFDTQNRKETPDKMVINLYTFYVKCSHCTL